MLWIFPTALLAKLNAVFVFCLGVLPLLWQPTLQSAPNTIAKVGGVGKAGASTFGATGENEGILIFGAAGVLVIPNVTLGVGWIILTGGTLNVIAPFWICLGLIPALTSIEIGSSFIWALLINP